MPIVALGNLFYCAEILKKMTLVLNLFSLKLPGLDLVFFHSPQIFHYTNTMGTKLIGKGDFTESPLPQNAQEYFTFIDCQLDFLNKRNKRIDQFANQ